MARTERRNLYRILQVQPEALPEVIRASYRALMGTLRAHPDLGGDHDTAAQLNAAYAVLGDPERRAAYDRSLRRPPRAAATTTAGRGAAPDGPGPAGVRAWREQRRCPFCGQGWTVLAPALPRCARCDSPLTPAPDDASGDAELLGRRRAERYARAADAVLRVPGFTAAETVRVRDLSMTGVSLLAPGPLPPGTVFRLTAAGFDAVAQLVAQRRQSAGVSVHARLLTLQVLRAPRGAFVSERA